ncbi:MAG: universal stress protein [Acinetobacter sp.]|nr:universal stress protein [Acinetobacter sp.]
MAYQHIVVPVDGSRTSLKAVSQAVALAKAFSSKVTAVSVVSLEPFVGVEFVDTRQMSADYVQQARSSVENILQHAQQLFLEQGVEVEQLILEGVSIHKELVKAVEQLNADLVVMGSHGRKGFKKMVLGSVAQSVLGEIHVPVLVVRD